MSPDLDLLQGTWSVTALEIDGAKMPGTMLENARVLVEGNRFNSTGMGAEYVGTLELDESSNPRQLTMKFDAGPENGNTNLCIYELRGNTWKMCIATRGSVRPTRFASQPGTGFAVETLKRGDVPATAKTRPRKALKKVSDTQSSVPTELDGEWQMISGIFDGMPMDKSETKWVRRVTRGNQTTVTAGPQTMMKFEFKIDSSHSPKGVDYLHSVGSSKGKTQRGVYELVGDVLTVCVSAPGSTRPALFESSPGSGFTLTVWKRLSP